jgi:hypothetical protein
VTQHRTAGAGRGVVRERERDTHTLPRLVSVLIVVTLGGRARADGTRRAMRAAWVGADRPQIGMPPRLLSLSGLVRPPRTPQHLASVSRLPSPSAPVDTGRAGVRVPGARARGDRAGGYWCMTGRSVGLSLLDQRRPACPDRAKVDESRPVPLPKSSAPPASPDAWRRRLCDPSGLAHSETA